MRGVPSQAVIASVCLAAERRGHDLKVSNGDTINGYPVYGDSDDWLYKDGHTFALLVEAYSPAEGLIGFTFYPTTAAAATRSPRTTSRGRWR